MSWEPVRPPGGTNYPAQTYVTTLFTGLPTVKIRSLILAGAAVALIYLGRWTAPEPPPRYPTVEIPEEAITENEPQLVEDLNLAERLSVRVRTSEVEPVQVATAPEGGDEELRAFCAASVAKALEAGPAIPGPEISAYATPEVPDLPTIFSPRSSWTDPGWWWGKDRTTVVGLLSTGGLRQISFEHHPSMSWRSDKAGGLAIRESRLGWWRGAVEFAVPLVAGYALGRVVH